MHVLIEYQMILQHGYYQRPKIIASKSHIKARLHSKSKHACLRHEHLRHACLGCLHINVFVHVSSISRHLPITICKQR